MFTDAIEYGLTTSLFSSSCIRVAFFFAVRIACWLPDARTDPRCTAHDEDQDPMKWVSMREPPD